jgi:hypothetical protein
VDIEPSAHRHGITDDEIRAALFASIRIGVVETNEGPVVIHAMPARAKYLR